MVALLPRRSAKLQSFPDLSGLQYLVSSWSPGRITFIASPDLGKCRCLSGRTLDFILLLSSSSFWVAPGHLPFQTVGKKRLMIKLSPLLLAPRRVAILLRIAAGRMLAYIVSRWKCLNNDLGTFVVDILISLSPTQTTPYNL